MAKPVTGDGVIYTINKLTGTYENIFASSYITVNDNTNLYVI